MNAPDYLSRLREMESEQNTPEGNCRNRVKDFTQFMQVPNGEKKTAFPEPREAPEGDKPSQTGASGRTDPRPEAPKLGAMMNDEEQAIRSWLASIGEADPATIAEVIGQCKRNVDARHYFIRRATEEPRIARMVAKLEDDPGIIYAIETHDEIDPDAILLTVAIRRKAAGELRIPKSRYDALALLRLIEQHTSPSALH